MNNKTKGILLSGLVFPGFGQFIQGKTRAGIIFVSGAVLGLISITYSAIHKGMILMDKIKPMMEGGKHLSSQDIIGILGQIPNNTIDNIGPIIFIGFWIGSIINAFKG